MITALTNPSRREFLEATAAAGAAVTLAPFVTRGLAAADGGIAAAAPTPTWVDRPMRWAQLRSSGRCR